MGQGMMKETTPQSPSSLPPVSLQSPSLCPLRSVSDQSTRQPPVITHNPQSPYGTTLIRHIVIHIYYYFHVQFIHRNRYVKTQL